MKKQNRKSAEANNVKPALKGVLEIILPHKNVNSKPSIVNYFMQHAEFTEIERQKKDEDINQLKAKIKNRLEEIVPSVQKEKNNSTKKEYEYKTAIVDYPEERYSNNSTRNLSESSADNDNTFNFILNALNKVETVDQRQYKKHQDLFMYTREQLRGEKLVPLELVKGKDEEYFSGTKNSTKTRNNKVKKQKIFTSGQHMREESAESASNMSGSMQPVKNRWAEKEGRKLFPKKIDDEEAQMIELAIKESLKSAEKEKQKQIQQFLAYEDINRRLQSRKSYDSPHKSRRFRNYGSVWDDEPSETNSGSRFIKNAFEKSYSAEDTKADDSSEQSMISDIDKSLPESAESWDEPKKDKSMKPKQEGCENEDGIWNTLRSSENQHRSELSGKRAETKEADEKSERRKKKDEFGYNRIAKLIDKYAFEPDLKEDTEPVKTSSPADEFKHRKLNPVKMHETELIFVDPEDRKKLEKVAEVRSPKKPEKFVSSGIFWNSSASSKRQGFSSEYQARRRGNQTCHHSENHSSPTQDLDLQKTSRVEEKSRKAKLRFQSEEDEDRQIFKNEDIPHINDDLTAKSAKTNDSAGSELFRDFEDEFPKPQEKKTAVDMDLINSISTNVIKEYLEKLLIEQIGEVSLQKSVPQSVPNIVPQNYLNSGNLLPKEAISASMHKNLLPQACVNYNMPVNRLNPFYLPINHNLTLLCTPGIINDQMNRPSMNIPLQLGLEAIQPSMNISLQSGPKMEETIRSTMNIPLQPGLEATQPSMNIPSQPGLPIMKNETNSGSINLPPGIFKEVQPVHEMPPGCTNPVQFSNNSPEKSSEIEDLRMKIKQLETELRKLQELCRRIRTRNGNLHLLEMEQRVRNELSKAKSMLIAMQSRTTNKIVAPEQFNGGVLNGNFHPLQTCEIVPDQFVEHQQGNVPVQQSIPNPGNFYSGMAPNQRPILHPFSPRALAQQQELLRMPFIPPYLIPSEQNQFQYQRPN